MLCTTMLQYVHEMRDLIYVETVMHTNGQNLLCDGASTHVDGNLNHADILERIECARHMVNVVERSRTDPTSFCHQKGRKTEAGARDKETTI